MKSTRHRFALYFRFALLPILSFTFALALAPPLMAEDAADIAKQLTAGLPRSINKIAVAGFETAEDAPAEYAQLSDVIAERLTTALVQNAPPEVLERRLLKKLLEEKGLELSGVLEGDNGDLSEIGGLLKVEAIVIGTLFATAGEVDAELNARLVDTKTGKILNAVQMGVQLNERKNDVQTYRPMEEVLASAALIQVALLLDTSNSMDGLILQTKTQLWKIVNELASSEKNGKAPSIQIAVYEYGNDNLNVSRGYVRQVLPFTDDMDLVSKQLFELKTNGGQEYAGYVIRDAVQKLSWKDSDNVYKTIFIAGNEEFNQGPVSFQEAVASGVQKDIFINAIYCGGAGESDARGWQAAAKAGNGMFLNIDQNRERRVVSTPYDQRISELGIELNSTYIPYGEGGYEAAEEQEMQDKFASDHAASGAMVERQVFKAKSQYSASKSWDIVTLVESGQVKIDEIKKEQLPPELQKKSDAELKAYIEERIEARKKMQNEITDLGKKRDDYIRKEQAKSQSNAGDALDTQMKKALKEQAESKNFEFQ